MNLSIGPNRYQSKSIDNKLSIVLEMDGQSMKQDSVTHRKSNQYISPNRGSYQSLMDLNSALQYLVMPLAVFPQQVRNKADTSVTFLTFLLSVLYCMFSLEIRYSHELGQRS